MEFKDYYKILGIPENADQKAVKTAYRRLARKYHPDVSKEADAEAQFKEISEAYEVLSDDSKRAEYDQLKQYGQAGQSFTPPPNWNGGHSAPHQNDASDGDFSEFFENIFGGARAGFSQNRQGRTTRGRDIEVSMTLSLEDTLTDEPHQIQFALNKPNDRSGLPSTKKTLKIKIPQGITDGERIRLKGQGEPGVAGGPAGDLYIHIALSAHPVFDVDGHDLLITVPIAPWEAALGAQIIIPTLGGKINVNVPKGSQTGQRLRIKGKGLRRKTGQADLYAVLKVQMPTTYTPEELALWKQLCEQSTFTARAQWES